MTEKEKTFLETREPFWLEDSDLRITMPASSDKHDIHSHLSKKYGYNWIFCIRGYWIPGKYIMLYTGNYSIPNVTVYVLQYLFNYFDDIKWIGLGCIIGEVGEVWSPQLVVPRAPYMMKKELL